VTGVQTCALPICYQWKYLKSPFAPKYWQSLAARVEADEELPFESRFAEFEELFKAAPKPVAFEFHLAAARKAIPRALIPFLKTQRNEAAEDAETPQAKERLKLYDAAAQALEGSLGASDATLASIDAAALNKDEGIILNSLRTLAQKFGVAGDDAPIEAKADREEEVTPVMQSIQQSLSESEKVLQKAVKK
jgi:hypothetical protein